VTEPDRPTRRRVQALAPDERRAALIEATIPLLQEYGPSVTTRQIAEAAGVAEGTIFGVFPDKASLIRAAIIEVFKPEPVVQVVESLRFIESLRDRMETIAELLMAGLATRRPLIVAIRSFAGDRHHVDLEFAAEMDRGRNEIVDAITRAIEPDRALLRRSPREVAQQLLFSIFATAGPFTRDQPLDAKELVSLLLDGVLIRTTTGDSPC
jgi:AcrR family transcriptional regulator